MKEIKAYHCDYCKKYSKSKGVMTRHERSCYHNPITKSCVTCIHFGNDYHKYIKNINGNDISCNQLYPVCLMGEKFINSIPDDGPILQRFNLKTSCENWFQKINEDDDE